MMRGTCCAIKRFFGYWICPELAARFYAILFFREMRKEGRFCEEGSERRCLISKMVYRSEGKSEPRICSRYISD